MQGITSDRYEYQHICIELGYNTTEIRSRLSSDSNEIKKKLGRKSPRLLSN
jgi:DNA-directed RNA polymerase specialized sigma24 family protein